MQARTPRTSAFTLKTERLGPLPLVNHFVQRMGLAALLDKHVPTTDARCRVPHAQALGVLLRSIVVEREPSYRAQKTVHGFAAGLVHPHHRCRRRHPGSVSHRRRKYQRFRHPIESIRRVAISEARRP
jgi:hypothetical protein